jgi:hypothetical protein
MIARINGLSALLERVNARPDLVGLPGRNVLGLAVEVPGGARWLDAEDSGCAHEPVGARLKRPLLPAGKDHGVAHLLEMNLRVSHFPFVENLFPHTSHGLAFHRFRDEDQDP